MARGRMINTKIANDLRFNAMSIPAQFLFMRAIPHLDRDGLIDGHPVLLHSKIAPLLPDFLPQMEQVITEWVERGFVLRYMDDETPVLYFVNFTKNQVGFRYDREAASDFNPPPGYKRIGSGLVKESTAGPAPQGSTGGSDQAGHRSGATPELLRTNSGVTPEEKKGKELEEKGAGDGGGFFGERTGDFKTLCEHYERNMFGLLTPMATEELNALLADYPVEWVVAAMKVAVQASTRKLSYVKGVLRRWQASGGDPLAPEVPAAVAATAPNQLAYAVNLS